MTKGNSNKNKKKTQKKKRLVLKPRFLWSGALMLILLAAFLFSNSQSLYALSNIWSPSSINDSHNPNNSHNPPVEKEDDVIPVVIPVNNGQVAETPENTGTGETPKIPETQEPIKNPGTPDAPKEPEPAKGEENQGSELPNVPENLNNSVAGETPMQPNQKDNSTASIFRGNPHAGKKVALTFDDGPYPIWTAEYLKVLSEYEVPAVFFLVGTRVEKYREIANKINNMGFELGSHSYRHGRLTLAKPEVVDEDFRKTIATISVTGDVKYFRPLMANIIKWWLMLRKNTVSLPLAGMLTPGIGK